VEIGWLEYGACIYEKHSYITEIKIKIKKQSHVINQMLWKQSQGTN
jgi:hypothetical protein